MDAELTVTVADEATLRQVLDAPPDPERHQRLAGYEPLHDDRLVVACDKYLEAKGCQLWGHFSIARVDDRWDAACWLAEQIRAVVGGETSVDVPSAEVRG